MRDDETLFRGMDARSWARLVSLVAPGLAPLPPSRQVRDGSLAGGMLLVAHDGVRVLKALHTLRGVVPADGPWEGRATLTALAAQNDTRFAFAVKHDATERFMERVGGRCTMDDDAVTTALMMLPDGHAAVLALFDGPALVSGVALRRRDGRVDAVHGVESLRAWCGPLGGDYRRDHRVIRAAVEQHLGPLAAGVFAPEETVHRLLRAEVPGVWAKAVAVRDVIVEPMPAWAAMATGVSAVRAAADESRRWALSADGWIARATRAVSELASSVDLESVLGFDPLGALGLVLRESRPRPAPPADE